MDTGREKISDRNDEMGGRRSQAMKPSREESGKMRILRESSFFHSDVYLHCYSLEADAAGKTQTYFCKTSSASIRFFKASEQVPGGCEEKVSQQSVRFLSLPVF